MKVDRKYEGIRYNNPDEEYVYNLSSHVANLRGSQYILKKVLDKVMLVPVERVLTMRREIEDAGN